MGRYDRCIPLLAALLLCSSCASLTKSWLTEINAFGQLTKGFSAYPGKVLSSYSQVHLQSELYKANVCPRLLNITKRCWPL